MRIHRRHFEGDQTWPPTAHPHIKRNFTGSVNKNMNFQVKK